MSESHPVRSRLVAGLVLALAALFRLVPWRFAQAAGRGLGSLAWRVARRDRRRMLDHLAIAFPELPDGERRRLARECFRHLGTTAGEVLWLFRRGCADLARHVELDGLEAVRAIRDTGRPIVFVTGHCGNWEMLAAACNCNGLRITVAVRGLDEEPLQRLVEGFRRRFGTHTVERGEAGAARELLRGLRDGALGMLIDQDTKVDGVWVPFFGRPAYTPVGAAKLALRRGVATVPIFIERREDGSHRVRFESPLELPADETAATAAMTAAIEAQVRRRPEQWVWMHRRWRTQPRAAILRSLSLLGLLSLALACGPRPSVEAPVGWTRLDLTEAEPAVEQDAHAAGDPYAQRIGYLGREEVRDMSRVPESQLAAFPFRRAPQIRVLEEAAGVRLAWRVELGADPYASFIPLGWSGTPCRCLYRFGLRDARGELHELHREGAEEVSPRAPGAVEVDLSGFAHSTVDLLLQVDVTLGAPAPAAGSVPSLLWGSPAVYHRRPVDGWRPPSADARPPNVILIGADTLRADHLGPWRDAPYVPTLTPALDRLAAESDIWLRAYSTFNSTNPSFASILSGLYGKNHGVYDFATALAAEHETLAERFAEAGYETLAVVSASHLGDHNSGLGQGFDRTVLSEHTFAGELPVDVAMEWIAERGRRSERGRPPFFAWLHLFDPHTPHTPAGPFGAGLRPAGPTGLHPVGSWTPFRRVGDRAFEEPVLGGERDLYAGEVAYLDRQVDRLLGFLESRDLLEETIVAFVADHGENLGEHGIDYRHIGLFETTTHVPLMIRWPGRAGPGAAERPAEPSERGRRYDGLVQTIDLFPTLLAGAGLEVPPSDGTDLRQLTHDGRPGRRAVFAEHSDGGGVMVRTPTHRYVRMAGVREVPDGPHLYDLAADPDETRDLAGRGLPVEAELSALLDRWLRDRRDDAPRAEERELTEEERRKLRSLGYLD